MIKAVAAVEKPQLASAHCLTDMPYRAIVFVRMNRKTPLYQVAGSALPAMGARNALREAHQLHGGRCFYCTQPVRKGELDIDHAEPRASGGGEHLQNLLACCRPCNARKGSLPIETFAPEAGREWLTAALKQIRDRLNRL